jgi:hypothetical protein
MPDGANEILRQPVGEGCNLVISDEGSPYDNFLHILLLDAAGTMIDGIEAGAALTTSIFEVVGRNGQAIDFRFFQNNKVYRLTVAEKPRFVRPFALPFGFRFKSYPRRHRLFVTERH